MSKIVFINDPSSAYISHISKGVIDHWLKDDDFTYTKSLQQLDEVRGNDLFHVNPLSIVSVENKQEIDNATQFLSSIDTTELEAYFPSGVIITSTANKNSTKKVSQQVERLGGRVYFAEKNKEDTTRAIVSQISLNKDAKDFLVSYTGEDYQSVIPLVESIAELPKKAHSKITIDDLMIRMPQSPGELPVWKLEDPLLSNDIVKFMETLSRVSLKNNSPIMASSYLLNKMRSLYALSVMGSSNKEEVEKATGLKGYPLTKAQRSIKKFSSKNLRQAVSVMVECDRQLKGGSRANSHDIFSNSVFELFSVLHA